MPRAAVASSPETAMSDFCEHCQAVLVPGHETDPDYHWSDCPDRWQEAAEDA